MTLPSLGVLVTPSRWGDAGQLAQLRAVAAAVAARGMLVCVPEHAGRLDYPPSALALAGLLLGSEEGMHLATTGVVTGRRDPVSILHDAEVLVAATGERGGSFTLGLVPGYDKRDLPGSRFADRYRALDAAVAAADALPLLVGATGPSGIRRAARAGGWMAPSHLSTDAIGARTAQLRELNPRAGVLVVRRWLPTDRAGDLGSMPLPAGVRTPRAQLVGGGPEAVTQRLAECRAAGAGTVVLGPVSSVEAVERLSADLTISVEERPGEARACGHS